MNHTTRCRWWDHHTGSDIIADLVDGEWDFAEREYQGVRWIPLKPTRKLRRKVRGMLREQRQTLNLG